MVFLALFAIPFLIALVTWKLTGGKVTPKELAVQLGVQVVICIGLAVGLHYMNMYDVEVWNGVVVSKRSEHVSCTHSHSCNCHQSCTGSGKNQSCSQVCDTCPDHPFDVDWNVYTSNRGEVIKIDRVDTQGVNEPGRFSAVRLGEPTSVEHPYKNYIKGSPDTLFRHQGLVEKYKGALPKHPRVYDYYHVNRLLTVGTVPVNAALWNAALDKLNSEVGAPKQANVLVVLVQGRPQEYYYALEEAWIGGKKNDIVVVCGVNEQLVPQWTTIMAWTKNEMFKVKLRDDVQNGGPLVLDTFLATVKDDVTKLYERKPMKDFEYLEASITPTTGQMAVGIIVSLLVSIGLSWYFATHDPFGDEFGSRREDLYKRGLYNMGRRKHW